MGPLTWVVSDNPGDWAQQISAVATVSAAMFTAFAAAFAGVYTLLTYRLMRSTALTARIAIVAAQRERAARLRPLLDVMRRLTHTFGAIGTASTPADLARVAAVVGEERLRFSRSAEGAYYVLDDASHLVNQAYAAVEGARVAVGHFMANRQDVNALHAVVAASQVAITFLQDAVSFVDGEMAASRSTMAELGSL